MDNTLNLLISALACRSLRGLVTLQTFCRWVPAAGAVGWLSWLTATADRIPLGNGWVQVSVGLTPAVAVLVALAVCSALPKRPPAGAVWLAAFIPLYVVDWLCSLKLFGSATAALGAVGGAGICDGLLLIPALAVLASFAAVFDRKLMSRLAP